MFVFIYNYKDIIIKLIEQIYFMSNEQVEHPSHYNQGKTEMWDYSAQHNLDFFEGNVIKYVTRWRHKNGIQDLKKAKIYLDKYIKIQEDKLKENS